MELLDCRLRKNPNLPPPPSSALKNAPQKRPPEGPASSPARLVLPGDHSCSSSKSGRTPNSERNDIWLPLNASLLVPSTRNTLNTRTCLLFGAGKMQKQHKIENIFARTHRDALPRLEPTHESLHGITAESPPAQSGGTSSDVRFQAQIVSMSSLGDLLLLNRTCLTCPNPTLS